jgi:hypothetical protein
MKLRAIRHSLIVLLAVSIIQSLAGGYPAKVNILAAAQDTHVDLYRNIWILNPKAFQITSAGKDYLIGIVPGQTLRVSTLNTIEPAAPGEDGRKFKPLFAVTLLLSDGRVIAQSDEITLDPGQFHSFDFKRADLPVTGEFGGRLQTRAKVIWNKLRLKTEFPSSVELVDEITGKTTVFISSKPKEIVVVGSK